MKMLQLSVLAGILAATTGAATAGSGSLNEFKPRTLPVLVRVDAQGKVTDVSPANELSPQLNRLLHSNLEEMVSKPATDKHGRPIASQVIINLVLTTTPNENGRYDAQFAYVSTDPVPAGSWYWVHIDGHRLALADRNARRPMEHIYHRMMLRPAYERGAQPRIYNRPQNTTRTTPSPPPRSDKRSR